MAKVNPKFLDTDDTLSSVSFSVEENITTKTKTVSDKEFRVDPRRHTEREISIKKELLSLYRKESNISKIYKETLRAVIHLFSELFIIDSEDNIVKVSCMHGNPERVVAKFKQESNIILPVTTVTQTTSDNDVDRRRYNPVLVNESYWDTEKQRAYRILSFSPRPVNIKYSINQIHGLDIIRIYGIRIFLGLCI